MPGDNGLTGLRVILRRLELVVDLELVVAIERPGHGEEAAVCLEPFVLCEARQLLDKIGCRRGSGQREGRGEREGGGALH